MKISVDRFGRKRKKVTLPARTCNGHVPVKSLVEVYFPKKYQSYTYYNDKFDLQVDDTVFVEGTMENECGTVRSVLKNFRIRTEDYKKVISVADRSISGILHIDGQLLFSFDPKVIPYSKVRSWFLPQETDPDAYTISVDGIGVPLDDPEKIDAPEYIFERGQNYYNDGCVVYLCVRKGHGRAIVAGGRFYEVEFDYSDNEVRNLICSCPCCFHCKHEVATMLQLKHVLERIDASFSELHRSYFAAISKNDLVRRILFHRTSGTITL